LRQITRSDALITTCNSWLIISTAQPVSRTHRLDLLVERGRARLIEARRRLIEQQHIGRLISARASSTRWN
jgi:hypothetical protein